ncbi:unnamed protein product [Meloidogyne enterolobii]|uniref:Uncharacterized protein n=3 Tax=Meloidogyne enterolobii TaxID=390850 RepID=A0A6V7U0E7_MELEN|nr:unnamed protein product [Meloidogyne enterolobii]
MSGTLFFLHVISIYFSICYFSSFSNFLFLIKIFLEKKFSNFFFEFQKFLLFLKFKTLFFLYAISSHFLFILIFK